MGIIVATSTVSDGSMLKRNDATNKEVIENRKKFLVSNGIAIDDTTRLKLSFDGNDFCRYQEITNTDKSCGMYDASGSLSDGITTKEPNHALFLPVADCIAATFYDPVHKILGLAHLGRHSLEQQGGTRFVEYLTQQFGSQPKDLKVWLGPAPDKEVYPIWALDNKGMKEAAFEQLHVAGILGPHITDNPALTNSDSRYYSYSDYLKGNRSEDGDHAMVAMMTD